ncbi:hypothetical protein P7C71_g5341, partial [Lecanoromycetidae sp. Uapishka_2]
MEAELSSEVGAVGRLFKSCIDLYWALVQRILILKFKEPQKQALRDAFGKFYFWGDGFYPFDGRLDEILANSNRLRNRVLLVLIDIGELLCHEKTGLFALIGKTFDDDKLNHQRQEVRALIEGIHESLDDASGSGSESDSGSDVSEAGSLLEDIISDLRSRNQCLFDLSGSLERPAADADLEEIRHTDISNFKVSGPAEVWTRKIVDNYPEIDVTLAERLGEANWQRYQRVSKKLDDAEPFEDKSESEDTDDESDRVGDLPEFTETTKSSADPSSIFSSVGRQTNTTGTSVSKNDFDYSFPLARKRRIAKDLRSQATYTSVVTNDQGERGWLKIPAMPKAVGLGKSFRCTVCGDKQKDIINQTTWKKHVFTDLEPYICTFQDCKGGIASFTTRKAWADHEFSVHRTTKIWTCNDCAAEFREKAAYREHAYGNHGNVLMRNQLEALINSSEKQVGVSEDNSCPFCSEKPGTKSRAFAMHVGRHMEEVALAVLPRDSGLEDDQGSIMSAETMPRLQSEPDGGSPRYVESSSPKALFEDFPRNVPTIPIETYQDLAKRIEMQTSCLKEIFVQKHKAQLFYALKLYVLDFEGQHLGHQEISNVVGVSLKDSDGDEIPSDAVISFFQNDRPKWYSDVISRKDEWERLAKESYADWLSGFTVRVPREARESTEAEKSTEQPPDPPKLPLLGFQEHRTAGSRIGLDDFNFLATIGKGNFSKIMLAEKKVSKEVFAIKLIKKEFVIENDEVPMTRVEKNVLLRATREQHPFIVHLHATFQTETRLYYVMEYVGGGDLMLHIQRGQFGTKRSRFYAAEVCLVLKWLHEQGILCRDPKLDNILLGKDGHIKVVDFGLCKEGMQYSSRTRTFCGTPEFMAPEILLDKAYGFPIDWWAFGVLLYQMLLQQSPFRGEDEDEIYDAILADEPLYPPHMPKNSVHLLRLLLLRDPERRLGSGPDDAYDVMQHVFFQEIDWDDLYHKRIPAPFIPTIPRDTDTSNFDSEFTSATPVLTPVQSAVVTAAATETENALTMDDFSFSNLPAAVFGAVKVTLFFILLGSGVILLLILTVLLIAWTPNLIIWAIEYLHTKRKNGELFCTPDFIRRAMKYLKDRRIKGGETTASSESQGEGILMQDLEVGEEEAAGQRLMDGEGGVEGQEERDGEDELPPRYDGL